MKKLMFLLGLGLIIGIGNIDKSSAQVRVSINIDIQPAWGPSGYDYAEFYYIPELNIYYDVINEMFYYIDRGYWISSHYLPVAYNVYDFYSLYKVVLNGVPYPWRHNYDHRHRYAGYCHNYMQRPIFYMTDRRYKRARLNYNDWVEPRYMPRDNGCPSSRDFAKNERNGRVSERNMNPASKNDRVASTMRSSSENISRSAGSRSNNTSNRSSSATNDNRRSTTFENNSNSRRSESSRSSNNITRSSSATTRTSSSRSSSSTDSRSSSNSRSSNSRSSSVSTRSSNSRTGNNTSRASSSSRSSNNTRSSGSSRGTR